MKCSVGGGGSRGCGTSFSSQEVSSTPGPDSMGNQGDGLGGVLDSARRGFEDEGGEGRLGGEKRKENNP